MPEGMGGRRQASLILERALGVCIDEGREGLTMVTYRLFP
jgi:hypothetical protein